MTDDKKPASFLRRLTSALKSALGVQAGDNGAETPKSTSSAWTSGEFAELSESDMQRLLNRHEE